MLVPFNIIYSFDFVIIKISKPNENYFYFDSTITLYTKHYLVRVVPIYSNWLTSMLGVDWNSKNAKYKLRD